MTRKYNNEITVASIGTISTFVEILDINRSGS